MNNETVITLRKPAAPEIVLRKPTDEDGAKVWELVRACKPLDENSMYCNLIQCDHFRDTGIAAEMQGELVGWISAYIPPSEEDTLFVWQVAVSPKARGRGLGIAMLEALLDRPECADVTRLRTTITKDNDASWALFRKLGKKRGEDFSSAPHFKKDVHFDGAHDTEHMVTIALDEAESKAA